MPKGGARPGAGRPAGSYNRITTEVRKLIDQVSKARGHGLRKIVEGLFERAENKDDNIAARVILEMRFGKPKEALDVTSGEKEIIGIGLAVPARRTPLKTDETQ